MLVQDRAPLSTLEEQVLAGFQRLGWPKLTPIQRKAYPVLLRQRHALLVAPTGSGKTEAAIIPLSVLLAADPNKGQGVRLLYITPLRALNRDILRRIVAYAEAVGLRVDIRHGDTPIAARQRMLATPPDVLITTPETLAILLTSPKMRLHLRHVAWVVIDELHELLGNERGTHLTVSLERLEDIVYRPFVRVGLSATVGELDEAAHFLVGATRTCAVLVDSSVRRYDLTCRYVQGSTVDAAAKIVATVRASSARTTLLFTNTRDEAEYLAAVLKAQAPDAPIEVHHGSLSREAREETETKLRAGEAGMVVSTSSLELGMDIGSVDLVLQWGSPRQAVKLAQRIGRSRHQVGAVAKGLVLTNRLDEELEGLALIDRVQAHSLEPSALHRDALDVLAHQLVGLTMETGVLRVEEALAILKRAYPFQALTAADVNDVLQLLERQAIVRYDGEIVRRRGPLTYQYYYENISTIPDIQQFEVKDVTTKKTIGRLDQVFVGEHGEPGKPFILKGSSWRIVSVDEEKKLVFVEPMYRDLSTVPYWVGELIPVDYETAQSVGRLRRRVLHDPTFPASEAQRKRLLETRAHLGTLPDEQRVIAEQKLGTSTVVVHTCWGTKLNQTFATLLSTLLSSKTGFLVEARSDPYRILLTSSGPLDAQLVVNAWTAMPANLEEILSAAVLGTHPLNWKTWYVARRFGVIARSAQYDRRAARLIQERFRGTALYREILRELFHEKYDLPRAREILARLRRGGIKMEARKVTDFSPLAKPILEYASGFAALPVSVEKAIIDLVKERLTNARHRLLCLSCGQWEALVRTNQIAEPLACPRCHSRLISETYPSDSELAGIVQKRRRGRALAKAEEERFRRAWKASSLIQTFGLKAITVLGAFGVGPDTAARILRRPTDDDELYRNIYRAEKTFVMTRAFWG